MFQKWQKTGQKGRKNRAVEIWPPVPLCASQKGFTSAGGVMCPLRAFLMRFKALYAYLSCSCPIRALSARQRALRAPQPQPRVPWT